MITDVEGTDFRSEINVPGKVVVQFHATWCQPCKAFSPHFEAASERDESARYLRADVESLDRSVLEEYQIASIPRVILFEDGRFVKDIESRTVYGVLEELSV
jgi:thioredoxin 1